MPLNEREAFDAMRQFIEGFWITLGKSGDIFFLLNALDGSLNQDNLPTDVSIWQDWLNVCQSIKDKELE